MEPASCLVIYIDDRFTVEKWLSRDRLNLSSTLTDTKTSPEFSNQLDDIPEDLETNVNAILAVFNQVYVCRSGRSFSAKLAETYESVKSTCSPIFGIFDVNADSKHAHQRRIESQKTSRSASGFSKPRPSLPRRMTFSSEVDECDGLQLLSRISSDLQVSEDIKLLIPVALVRMVPDETPTIGTRQSERRSFPGKNWQSSSSSAENVSAIDSQVMLQCLDAGALDVIPSPLNHEKVMGLTVHAYRIYKTAKTEQSAFLATASNNLAAARRRQQSWVGIEEEEKPYAYLREAMVKKLLKAICEPETAIEDSQHRELCVEAARKHDVQEEIGKWSFCAHDFSEDELVYAGYYMLSHALTMDELEHWRMGEDELLRFVQACRVAYNSYVLYHNFRHAVDVMQFVFYSLVQIGTIPPYPARSTPPPLSQDRSPIAELLHPFEALTLLISAIGHDVGHPGVNNMFLVKLNAPLAQLYNDQSVLEAFHCAAFSQILRRHWPSAFADQSMRKLLIKSILATDMGVHHEYMQQLLNLQEKIHESKTVDGWAPKHVDSFRNLVCGLLIKCADISNVARPWAVAEKWTHLLQQEFASQGEMERQVGMETTLFGGPPDLDDMIKLANGQIGFMTIFAHPLFANVADVIPALGFAAVEISTNKGVWITRIEQKRRDQLRSTESFDDGAISPRSQSPSPRKRENLKTNSSQSIGSTHTQHRRQPSAPTSPLSQPSTDGPESTIASSRSPGFRADGNTPDQKSPVSVRKGPLEAELPQNSSSIKVPDQEVGQSSSGVSPSTRPTSKARRPEIQARRSSNTAPNSLHLNGPTTVSSSFGTIPSAMATSNEQGQRPEESPRYHQYLPLAVERRSALPNEPVQSIYHQPQGVAREEQTIGGTSADAPSISPHTLPGRSPRHHQTETQSPTLSSAHTSYPSTIDQSSLLSSGGQTYLTNVTSGQSVMPTEPTSFLTRSSREELQAEVAASNDGPWSGVPKQRGPVGDQAKIRSDILPSPIGVAADSTPPGSPLISNRSALASSSARPAEENGEGSRTKHLVYASTFPLSNGDEQDTSSHGDDGSGRDGEANTKKRMGRLKFWRKVVSSVGQTSHTTTAANIATATTSNDAALGVAGGSDSTHASGSDNKISNAKTKKI